MKTDVAGAGLGAIAVLLNNVSVVFLGAPLALVVAAFGGALFGATYFPPAARVSRPWAVIVNTVAGVILASVVAKLAGLDGPLLSGVAFLIAAAPVMIFRWIANRLGIKPENGNAA